MSSPYPSSTAPATFPTFLTTAQGILSPKVSDLGGPSFFLGSSSNQEPSHVYAHSDDEEDLGSVGVFSPKPQTLFPHPTPSTAHISQGHTRSR